jgi:hypothetical protein
MAKIGSISLTIGKKLDSGLALLLIKPPEKYEEIIHKGAILRVSPDTSFAVCIFNGAKSHEEAVTIGSSIAQECLDLLSMTGKEDLATRDSSDEYIAWWVSKGGKTISYNSTITLKFSVGSPRLQIRDKNGKVIPEVIISPNYHLAFRYYRLAQVTDDLFDSFRNMYLAFEVLLSSRNPRKRKGEKLWLEDSLKKYESSLHLQRFVPEATPSSVDYLIETIYNNARLPLFHAKVGEAKYIPIDSSNRETVSQALSLLTKIVIRMAEVWYNCRRLGGGVNLAHFEEYYQKLLMNSYFVLTDDPNFTSEDSPDSPSIKNGQKFLAKFDEHFLNERRPNVNGILDVSTIKNTGPLLAIFLANGQKTLLSCTLESPIDLDGFDHFETFQFLRGYNASQPKYLFSR